MTVASDLLRTLVPPTGRSSLIESFAQISPKSIQRLSEKFLDLPIPAYVRREKLLFIHVPRNAGNLIAMQIYKRGIAHRPAWFYQLSDAAWFAERKRFAVVRNPWDRLISAYEFARQGGNDIVNVDLRVMALAAKSKSFKHFVMDCLLGDPDSVLHQDPSFKSQSFFLLDRYDNNIMVEHTFRFESLGTLADWLKQFNIVLSLDKRINETTGRGVLESYYHNDNQLIEAVALIYKSDIERFHYDFASTDGGEIQST